MILTVGASGREFEVQGTAAECYRNEQQIRSALETYASEHRGRYPQTLSRLVPKYLASLPRCPESKADTYSPNYQSKDGLHFTFACGGSLHDLYGVAPNNPRCSSDDGVMVDRAVRKRSLSVQFAEKAAPGPLTAQIQGGWNLIRRDPTGILIAPEEGDSEIILGTYFTTRTLQAEVDERKNSRSDIRTYLRPPLQGLMGNMEGNRSLFAPLENKPRFSRFVLAENGKTRYLFLLICTSEAERRRYSDDFDRTVLSVTR